MDTEEPRAARSALLSHPDDIHCVVYHLVTVAAYCLAFWLWLHPEASGLQGFWPCAAFTLAAAPLLGWIGGIDVGVNFHNHTHRRIFTSPSWNRWFARLWTPTGGWPAAYWRHLHVTVHHAHLLEPRDWTVPATLADGRFESSLRYQLRHWPWRTCRHFYLEIRSGRFQRHRAAVELAWFLAIWSIPFWIDPLMAVCLWVLPHWCANCVTLGRGMYVQHAGCEGHRDNPAHPHSNNFVLPFYNRTMFNIGYHAEHHDHPEVHWSELPDLHHRLAAKPPVPPSEAAATARSA